ncbi:MAG: TetR/AcrR family transcriptional regulator [Actinomycetaceae bacterium]|nr:TetR/AcrR family transcriptional regulator [Actinomycetaceae bacterium]
MPKTPAPAARRHRDVMFERLIDAAEDILRTNGPGSLTAGAVATRAGIARNSIYRYVDSIDDLPMLVLERYLPRWQQRAEAAMAQEVEPYAKLIDLVVVSLQMGAETGHQWLIDVLRSTRSKAGGPSGHPKHATSEVEEIRPPVVLDFHRRLAMKIAALWYEITPVNADMNARLTRALLDAGLRALDDGVALERVQSSVLTAVTALAKDQPAQ